MNAIENLRRLEAEATPGPWEFDDEDEVTVRLPEPRAEWKKDAALIVAMRNALPGLLDEVEWLREVEAERDLLQDIIDNRPAINAALPESYIRWSQSLYSGELTRATLTNLGGRDD